MENETRGKAITMKKVFNPTSEDLHFQYDSAEYVLSAGKEGEFVDYIAVHAAKKLADKNVKTNNPEEHQVLMGAYLENSEPGVIAERLGIDLAKIRAEVMTKEKEKARVINLEAQMMDMKKEMDEMKAEKKVKVSELSKNEDQEEVAELKVAKKTDKKSKKGEIKQWLINQ